MCLGYVYLMYLPSINSPVRSLNTHVLIAVDKYAGPKKMTTAILEGGDDGFYFIGRDLPNTGLSSIIKFEGENYRVHWVVSFHHPKWESQ